MTVSTTWTGTVTARSSIAHGGETRGTISLLRRELIAQPGGALLPVPVISGNAFRGQLRRLGEELLRDTLRYETELPLSAAHALRGGGSLAKVNSEPLSGARLLAVRQLIPQIGVFGAAAGGRIIDSALQVGKLIPHVTETNRITGANATQSAFEAVQLETYTRHDDSTTHTFPLHLDPPAASDTPQMLYRVETFPAGTTFSAWIRLDHATDLEHAFFCDVLDAFLTGGHLGGRVAIGHGQVTANLTAVTRGTPVPLDWRQHLQSRRDDALAALHYLT